MKKNLLWLCLAGLVVLACSLTARLPQATQPRAAAIAAPVVSSAPQFAAQKPQSATKTPKPNICAVLAQNLHLRAAGGVSAPVLAYLKAGDPLTRTPNPPAGAWVEVITQTGVVGWVNSKFINCNGVQK